MITFVSKGKTEQFDSFDEVPYEATGHTADLSESREKGLIVHREELDNKPEYYGWCGPMWDGGDYRYETWEVYNMMSN